MDKKAKQLLIVISFTLIACACAITLIASYAISHSAVETTSINELKIGEKQGIRYKIEDIAIDKDGNEYVTGWCVLVGVTYDLYNYGNDRYRSEVYNYMNLALVSDNVVDIVPTKLQQRPDIVSSINDGINYAYCGFVSRIPAKEVETHKNAEYALVLKDPEGMRTIYVLSADSSESEERNEYEW